jgi:hypothetical protein
MSEQIKKRGLAVFKPKDIQVNSDGKIHRKNRKRNKSKVKPLEK